MQPQRNGARDALYRQCWLLERALVACDVDATVTIKHPSIAPYPTVPANNHSTQAQRND
jgi:hypothetical protein